MRRTAKATAVLDNLDRDLADTSKRLGERLSWSAAEVELRDILARTIDRRELLHGMLDKAETPKECVRLSTEIRLLNAAISKLLKEIRTEPTAQESRATVRNRAAANVRWERERAAEALRNAKAQ
jgi:hypothetical protein